jgi:hypothetical protein
MHRQEAKYLLGFLDDPLARSEVRHLKSSLGGAEDNLDSLDLSFRTESKSAVL